MSEVYKNESGMIYL